MRAGLAPSSTLAFIGATLAAMQAICAIPIARLVSAYGPVRPRLLSVMPQLTSCREIAAPNGPDWHNPRRQRARPRELLHAQHRRIDHHRGIHVRDRTGVAVLLRRDVAVRLLPQVPERRVRPAAILRNLSKYSPLLCAYAAPASSTRAPESAAQRSRSRPPNCSNASTASRGRSAPSD